MQHTSTPVPVAATSANMKIIWILLSLSLTFADKLDRTYLPPAGSAHSGGSPGAINAPLDLPKTQSVNQDERFSKSPNLVVGIDRVGPNQANNVFEENISTHRPNSNNNFPTKTTSAPFVPTSPFPKTQSVSDFTPDILKGEYNSDSQKVYNTEKQPTLTRVRENNRAYLPPYSEGDNKENVVPSTSSSIAIDEKYLGDGQKYIQPDSTFNQHSSSFNPTNERQENPIFSSPSTKQLFPTSANNNITPGIYRSTIDPDNFSTIPIQTTDNEYSALDEIRVQRPERIQAESDRQATIINYGQTLTPEGYAYGYDTSNGIHADEEGVTANGVKAKGSYSYTGDDGNIYQVEYTADENGFMPKGAHLPTAPPVPDAILKVIEQAKKDQEAGIYDDGSYNEEKYGPNYNQGYKSTNNINEVNYAPMNKINIGSGDRFNDEQDKTQLNDFDSNNVRKQQYKNQNNNIPYDGNFQNTDSPYEDLNKNDEDISSVGQQNNIYPGEPNNFFRSTLTPDTSFISDAEDKISSQVVPGYEYFPPQSPAYDTNRFESFPTRFSVIEANNDKVSKETNSEKVTAKPFLTPYVSRKDDYSDTNNFDEQGKKENFENGPTRSGYEKENYKPEDKSTYRESAKKPLESSQQPQYGERLGNPVVSGEEGYFYQSSKKPSIDTPRISYTSSTAAPTGFPDRTSATQSINTYPERDQSSYQTKTSTSSGTPSTKSPVSLPMQTKRPSFINEATSTYPNNYSKIDSFPKITSTSSPGSLPGITRSGMTYEPESYHRNVYLTPTNTGNVIGEDFTGPKQPQRYDPATGYHY